MAAGGDEFVMLHSDVEAGEERKELENPRSWRSWTRRQNLEAHQAAEGSQVPTPAPPLSEPPPESDACNKDFAASPHTDPVASPPSATTNPVAGDALEQPSAYTAVMGAGDAAEEGAAEEVAAEATAAKQSWR